ncbi:hypothetical protein Rumeso_02809 [Rubellimicrobium mesophilum DSM 19309]|uniref:Uncharacterized protein n=1 Tax=Rubellimicrobium mesophilum DSM 19309 TaxID=442562 RepID=A0A017HMI4_9RHOB|nr:hypothetical protein [Rubellimicrobium mesophilum]EYD75722.1 hypothetical protein Rumeso_02809 [Rubellimicrobium mesophilum DSM 19309]
MIPPRLHVLTALASPMALVLRRGPAGVVASLGWDRASGEVMRGQWLRGRIYEYRADISPDGTHWVYFAARGGYGWTAVARVPWLRAVVYLPQNSTWCGGGAFTPEGKLWLNGASPLTVEQAKEVRPAPTDAYPHSTDGLHGGNLHAAMLERRGWRREGQAYDAVLRRDLPGGGRIELSFAIHARNRAIVSSRYATVDATGARTAQSEWEWADLWRDRLQFAARGALWERPLAGGEARRLHDLSGLAYEEVRAPYEGVWA